MVKGELYNVEDVLNFHVNRVFRRTRLSRDDLYQTAYMGYLKAQENFKAEYGQMSLSYASKFITASLNNAINNDNYWMYNTEPYVENTEDTTVQDPTSIKQLNQIKQNMHRLTDREQNIIFYYYLAPKTKSQEELGIMYNLSQQRVNQIIKKATDKIKSFVEGEYNHEEEE